MTQITSKEYIIEYNGEIVSTNEYKSANWRKYKPKVDKIKKIFWALIINASLPKFEKIALKVRYWSRHDVDNVSATSKIFIDQLVKCGRLPDDNKKYWEKLTIEADNTLVSNTVVFEMIDIG